MTDTEETQAGLSPEALSEVQLAIKRLADQRVQIRIAKFKRAVSVALGELFDEDAPYAGANTWPGRFTETLKALSSDDMKNGWPPALWVAEEKAVQTELFETVETVQKMLAVPETGPDACKPAEGERPEDTERFDNKLPRVGAAGGPEM